MRVTRSCTRLAPTSPQPDADPCGSWLACDAATSVFQMYRGDAIAGKPAPTFGRFRLLDFCQGLD
ncbi:hypothetical protein C7A11_08305 [Pseudomonas simiae]|nr:hypothetical protein C7A11_08305 [Pseudomonas simiae]